MSHFSEPAVLMENNLTLSKGVDITFSLFIMTRDVEAVIFQPLSLPHLMLPLPLLLTKNEKTTVDNIFQLLSVCSLPSSILYHFEKTKTFIYCYYFTYFA